jgi:DNA repair photolyase
MIREVRVKRALGRSGLPEYDYSLNPYLGCLHGCIYCYAMEFTRGEPGEHWGSVVYVKVNLLDVLKVEVRKLRPGIVGLSTITDPYQPVESRYGLSRGSISLLCGSGFHVSIQTRSPLILRDIDVLKACGGKVDVGFTITTMRGSYRAIEPGAPHPRARAEALRRISNAGIPTWIFLGPVIPGINDHEEDYLPVIELAAETGSEVIVDRFRVRNRPLSLMRSRLGQVPHVDEGWWGSVLPRIMDLCARIGARCTTAEEEWRRARDGGLLNYMG